MKDMTDKIPSNCIVYSFRTNLQWMRAIHIVLVFFFVFMPLSVRAFDFQSCDGCHEATLIEDRSRFSLHSPFALQQCEGCHEAKSPLLTEEVTIDDSSTILADKRKINWLGDSIMVATDHVFVMPADKTGDTLVVEQKSMEGRLSRQEIVVPALDDLVEVQDGGELPVISDLQVLKVQRGVFLSATIAWQTNTITDAHVRFGHEKLSQSSQPGIRLGRSHEVVLYNLKPDKTYLFTATSNDLFGRSQTSENLTFSTARPLDKPQVPSSRNLVVNDQKDVMDYHFLRLGTNYFIELAFAQPVAVFIGSQGVPMKQSLPDKSSDALEAGNDSHDGLSSKQVVTLEVCRSCHQNQSTTTHPVNVYPKPGMIIPPEYPTLPDGRITCMSCHEAHGSDYEFLMIVSGKRELCIGCHRDMI